MPNEGGILQQLPGHVWRLETVLRAKRQYEVDNMPGSKTARRSDTDGPDMSNVKKPRSRRK